MLVGIALIAISCSKSDFPQTKELDEKTKVTLNDAWLYGNFVPTNHTPLLRAHFTFEGSDPNQTYNLKAAIRAEENSEDIKSQYVLPPAGRYV